MRPGEEHVVDEHDDGAVDIFGDMRRRLGQNGPQPDVVAMQGDIDHAHRWAVPFDLLERIGDAFGDGDSPGLEPDDDDSVETLVALEDLVRHALGGPLDVGGRHHLLAGNESAPIRGRETTFSFSHWLPRCRASLTGPASRSPRNISAATAPPAPPFLPVLVLFATCRHTSNNTRTGA